MLQGMAPAQARMVKETVGRSLLLYTPIVAPESFDVAISYLFRRLEENAAEGNFLRVLFNLTLDSPEFEAQARAFEDSVAGRFEVSDQPRRVSWQDPGKASPPGGASFTNEPDTDPALAPSRDWARRVVGSESPGPAAAVFASPVELGRALMRARNSGWNVTPPEMRRVLLHRTAEQLARRPGDLIGAMVHEGRKIFAQADPEVSEAIDFARYYGDRALELGQGDGARFLPLGVVVVISPWNFPVAIPAGGVFGALAAGNPVLLKPSDLTPRCAEIVAECAWAAEFPAMPSSSFEFPRGRRAEAWSPRERRDTHRTG